MDEFYGDADGFSAGNWEYDESTGEQFITIPNGDPPGETQTTGDSGQGEETQESLHLPVYVNNIEPLTNEENTETVQEVSIPALQSSAADASGEVEDWDGEPVRESPITVYEVDTSTMERLLEENQEILENIEVRAQNMTMYSNAQMGLTGMVLGAFIIFLFIGRMR